MKLGINTSVWSRAGYTLPEALLQVSEVGLRYVDIFGKGHGDPKLLNQNKELLAATEDILGRNNLIVASYCALVPRNPGNPLWNEENLAYMRSCMELAVRWSCKKVILDSGERERGLPFETTWSNLRTFAGRCADIAQQLGIVLTLELEPYSYNLVNNLEKVLQLIAEVASTVFFVNVDTGHLNVIRAAPPDLVCLRGLVAHVHLSDNLGVVDSHDEIGFGATPNAAYLQALIEAGFEETAGKLNVPAVAAMEIHNMLLPPLATPPPNLQVKRSRDRILTEFQGLEVK
jgi:sugar phosphate isomerase/epimerase